MTEIRDGRIKPRREPPTRRKRWFELARDYMRTAGAALLDHWGKAVIGALGAAGILVAQHVWTDAKYEFISALHSMSEETALKYARLSDLGSHAKVAVPRYDPVSGRQFIAVAYQGLHDAAFVRLFEIVDTKILPIGEPLPIMDVKGSYVLDAEQVNLTKHYFGFIDARGDRKVQVYAIWVDANTGGYTTKISVMETGDRTLYTMTDGTNSIGTPIMRPDFSSNVHADKVRSWLIAKSWEILETERWDEAPLTTIKNGLQTSPSKREFLATSIRKWFELNGVDATEGELQTVTVPTNVLSVKEVEESSVCTVNVGQDRWYVQFKGPIFKREGTSNHVQLVYVPDPRNLREPQGMVLSKSYLLFALTAPHSKGTALVAMNRTTGAFVHLPLSDDETAGPSDDDSSDDDPPLKDTTLERLEVKDQQLVTEGGPLHFTGKSGFDPNSELPSAVSCSTPDTRQ